MEPPWSKGVSWEGISRERSRLKAKLHALEQRQGGQCDRKGMRLSRRKKENCVARSHRVLQTKAKKSDFIPSDREQLEDGFEHD